MTIYLDNAATTALRPEALEAMLPFLRDQFANPSSPHSGGQRARRALDEARERTASAIGATPAEIVFTGSGSEADCLAIFGMLETQSRPGRFITSAIEHHAVLHAADALRERGHAVSILPVDAEGFVSPQVLASELAELARNTTDNARRTTLVSIMHGNNEIGTVQRIAKLARIAHDRGALFHTDAVQTVGHIPVNVRELDVDALSLSSHKFEGPKGVGALYLRNGIAARPLVYGGGQEGGRRSGTENVAGIVGLGTAISMASATIGPDAARVAALRDRLIDGAIEHIQGTAINGARAERLPNNASLRFADTEGQTIVLALDVAGIAASTGSACTSGSLEPSHVLTAIGLAPAVARGTVRFSLGRATTDSEIESLLDALPGTVSRLRHLSGALTIGGGLSQIRE